MAVNHDPIVKKCRALDISPAALGYDKKSTRNPGADKRKKLSEYGMQLREKQKLKFVYGVLENQFAHYYEMATKMEGITGVNLLKLLECRLDNVVYRMGMAKTRKEARQLVRHNHFRLNGKKANIPSILVKVGDVITVNETSRSSEKFKSLVELMQTRIGPKWLEVDKENAVAKVVAQFEREDLDFPVEEQLVVELYSK
ncbi:MAG: 30S ribosomal protein S4 [Oscillospiraceae bacterium]|nr:30S ribosomal protein S4 [Oscillospiraceae bacterium]